MSFVACGRKSTCRDSSGQLDELTASYLFQRCILRFKIWAGNLSNDLACPHRGKCLCVDDNNKRRLISAGNKIGDVFEY